MSDSKYSKNVARKRRAHESNVKHLKNIVELTMERKMYADDYQRHYDIVASNEWKTRNSYNANNWHNRQRKQFIRYVVHCSSIYLHFKHIFVSIVLCALNHS